MLHVLSQCARPEAQVSKSHLTVLYLMAPNMPIRVYRRKPMSPTVNPMPPIMIQRSHTHLPHDIL